MFHDEDNDKEGYDRALPPLRAFSNLFATLKNEGGEDNMSAVAITAVPGRRLNRP